MAEGTTTAPATGKKGSAFKGKIAGIPRPVVLIVGGLGLYLGYRWYKNRQAASTSSTATPTASSGTTADTSGGYGSGGGYGGYGGGGNNLNPPTATSGADIITTPSGTDTTTGGVTTGPLGGSKVTGSFTNADGSSTTTYADGTAITGSIPSSGDSAPSGAGGAGTNVNPTTAPPAIPTPAITPIGSKVITVAGKSFNTVSGFIENSTGVTYHGINNPAEAKQLEAAGVNLFHNPNDPSGSGLFVRVPAGQTSPGVGTKPGKVVTAQAPAPKTPTPGVPAIHRPGG